MASCPGKVNNTTCYSTVYRCKKCGGVGCEREKCTNQSFESVN